MTTTAIAHNKPWDLSLALQFVNSLSFQDVASDPPPHGGDHDKSGHGKDVSEGVPSNTTPAQDIEAKDFATQPLGDLTKVWQFLGVPSTTPTLTQSPAAEQPFEQFAEKEDYASDGATYRVTRSMTAKAIEHSDITDGTDGSGPEASSAPSETDAPKKEWSAARKARKARKNQRRQERREQAQLLSKATVSESEAEPVAKREPARQASAHYIVKNATSYQHIKPNADYHSYTPRQQPTPITNGTDAGEAVQAVAQAMAKVNQERILGTPSPKPRVLAQSDHNLNRPSSAVQSPTKAATPKAGTTTPKGTQLLPSSITPMPNKQSFSYNKTATMSHAPIQGAISNTDTAAQQPASAIVKATPKPKPMIEPKIILSGEDRNYALLMKILGAFPSDLSYLVNPMNLTTHNNDPNGIHVFVDASNIFIGFMDHLKASRGIHPRMKMTETHLSFDALALLMERRRPVARRVLAGSKPDIPAFDKAKAVGYECSILDKVHKARKLTDRVVHFKELESHRTGRFAKAAPPCNTVDLDIGPYGNKLNGHESGSGSETNTPQYAPEAWIEQGVDEILHMKMLESIVDAETPSTMILATGDAAAAEYSDGFMKMLQRALVKGWNVELVSWSKNINGMYRHPKWLGTWAGKFRIIFLDDFAEELLDM